MSAFSLFLKQAPGVVLTPQLQQSIRLLQLSQLELEEEIAQVLEDNPFLERLSEQLSPEEIESATDIDAGTSDNLGASLLSDESNFDDMRDHPQQDTNHDFSDPYIDQDHEWMEENIISPHENEGSTTFSDLDDQLETDWHDDAIQTMENHDWDENLTLRSSSSGTSTEDKDAVLTMIHQPISLKTHLLSQLGLLKISPHLAAMTHFLIENLDANGWLIDSIDQLKADWETQAGQSSDDFDQAWQILRRFDPIGVGAENWVDCVLLQLENHTPSIIVEHAKQLLTEQAHWLATKNYQQIKQKFRIKDSELREILKLIGQLDPKPGLRFVEESTQYITPDIIVDNHNGVLTARVNQNAIVRLQLIDTHGLAIRQFSPILKEKLREAKWLVRCLDQRLSTLTIVAQCIIERQKRFFTHGPLGLRPMTLRDVADDVGLHDSTISRVTTNKYMQTPLGLFELKYFFTSTIQTESGGGVSAQAIRTYIQTMIKKENPKKPLSDQMIVEELEKQGFVVARRTVAKYREMLGIPPKNLRKIV